MWSPTHVQVTVQRARGLKKKGRIDTNDAFVLIQMGKEKFQTSVKEKCCDPEWYEECDLTFHKYDHPVVLVVFHRNLLGIDEFLGELVIPLQQFEYFDRPVNKWYSLTGRSGKDDGKSRGQLEVRIAFVVRSSDTQSLNEFGVNKKKRTLKGIATSVGHKLQKFPSRSFSLKTDSFDPRARLSKIREKKNSLPISAPINMNSLNLNDSFDIECPEDFDVMSSDEKVAPLRPARKLSSAYSSTLSLPQSAMIPSIQEDKSLEEQMNLANEQASVGEQNGYREAPEMMKSNSARERAYSVVDRYDTRPPFQGEWTQRISSRMKDLTRSEINLSDVSRNGTKEKKSTLESLKNTLRRHTLQFDGPEISPLKILNSPKKNSLDTKKINNKFGKDVPNLPDDVPSEVLRQYENMNQQDLVSLAIHQQTQIENLRDKVSDLENYLDNLLVGVMETTPKLLQIQYGISRTYTR